MPSKKPAGAKPPRPAYSGPAIPVPMRFAALHAAWERARRGKRPSASQLAFASNWLLQLQQLHADVRAGRWAPRHTVSFIVQRPKTREIHSPHFADRVLHHWLVPRLEALYEPVFIHDSYANRQGKGSHAAVARLQRFMRQRNGQGWYLQLDVHNFFNSIHRPTLYGLLKRRLHQAQRQGNISAPKALALQSLCHKLLAQPAAEHCNNPAAARRLPPHKRLRNARPGCGLPIGNLSSQFFANVYLNELDQFVKHQLKVKHYLRYVDDFVLLADSPAPLQYWQTAIACFLRQRLGLQLKESPRLAPLRQGVDFLGYIVRPSHLLVRPRVLKQCRARLYEWERRHVRRAALAETVQGTAPNTPQGPQDQGPQDQYSSAQDLPAPQPERWHIQASAADLAALQATLGSYWGHFRHASSQRLRRALWTRFGWLGVLFAWRADGSLAPRWVLQGVTLAQQMQALQTQWPQAHSQVQKGRQWLQLPAPGQADGSHVTARQTGWLRHGTRRREVLAWHNAAAPPEPAPPALPPRSLRLSPAPLTPSPAKRGRAGARASARWGASP